MPNRNLLPKALGDLLNLLDVFHPFFFGLLMDLTTSGDKCSFGKTTPPYRAPLQSMKKAGDEAKRSPRQKSQERPGIVLRSIPGSLVWFFTNCSHVPGKFLSTWNFTQWIWISICASCVWRQSLLQRLQVRESKVSPVPALFRQIYHRYRPSLRRM